MFLRSVKQIKRLIKEGMSNIYVNISFLEKLMFSKHRFSKFKNLSSGEGAPTHENDIEF